MAMAQCGDGRRTQNLEDSNKLSFIMVAPPVSATLTWPWKGADAPTRVNAAVLGEEKLSRWLCNLKDPRS